jgi:hypothetical protein
MQLQRDGIVFFLGSIFYPKIMRKIYTSSKSQRAVDALHNALYTFSISKLDYLYTWSPYRQVVHHFLDQHFDNCMAKNPTMTNHQGDFVLGRDFLRKYYRNEVKI